MRWKLLNKIHSMEIITGAGAGSGNWHPCKTPALSNSSLLKRAHFEHGPATGTPFTTTVEKLWLFINFASQPDDIF